MVTGCYITDVVDIELWIVSVHSQHSGDTQAPRRYMVFDVGGIATGEEGEATSCSIGELIGGIVLIVRGVKGLSYIFGFKVHSIEYQELIGLCRFVEAQGGEGGSNLT